MRLPAPTVAASVASPTDLTVPTHDPSTRSTSLFRVGPWGMGVWWVGGRGVGMCGVVRGGLETPPEYSGAWRRYGPYHATGSRPPLRKLDALGLAPQARRPAVLA